MKKFFEKIYFFLFFLAVFFAVFYFIPVRADVVKEMNQKIEDKKDEIDSLNKKLKIYDGKIKEAKSQTVSLKNKLGVLENEIEKNTIDLEITEKQIQKTNLEIQKIVLTIDEKEREVKKKKQQLSEFIRVIYQTDQVSYLEVFLLNDSFSEFFDHYEYLQNVQESVQKTLKDLKTIKADLELQKEILEDKRARETELKKDLEIKKGELESRVNEKETLLRETKKSEVLFQSYVEELKQEQKAINNEIVSLEKKIRAELEKREKEEKFKNLGAVRLSWPVPGRQITAYFYDPEYPYRYIFEHPAIDIRAAQGTPVSVAESGYVGKVKDGGKKGYSYIMVIHADGISTVYGHVSAIYVKQGQFVKKGDTIGLTGGKPGTPGAGPLTTGPHVHFEVRKNGIPVNPIDYLP